VPYAPGAGHAERREQGAHLRGGVLHVWRSRGLWRRPRGGRRIRRALSARQRKQRQERSEARRERGRRRRAGEHRRAHRRLGRTDGRVGGRHGRQRRRRGCRLGGFARVQLPPAGPPARRRRQRARRARQAGRRGDRRVDRAGRGRRGHCRGRAQHRGAALGYQLDRERGRAVPCARGQQRGQRGGRCHGLPLEERHVCVQARLHQGAQLAALLRGERAVQRVPARAHTPWRPACRNL